MDNNTVKLILELENKTNVGFAKMQKELKGLQSQTSKTDKTLSKTDKTIAGLSAASSGASVNISKLKTGLGSVVAIAAAVAAALTLIVKNAVDTNKELTALSNIAGVNQKDFGNLSIAYDSFGVSADDLASSIKDLNERLNDANTNGAGEFVDIAKSLGLNIKELADLEPAELLSRMNEELAKLSEKDRISFADRLGSDAFIKVSQAAAKSGDEIDRLYQKTQELNLGLKETDAKVISEIGQQFSLLGGNIDTLTKETIVEFSDEIIATMKRLNNEVSNIRESKSSGFESSIASLGILQDGIYGVFDAFELLKVKMELSSAPKGGYNERTLELKRRYIELLEIEEETEARMEAGKLRLYLANNQQNGVIIESAVNGLKLLDVLQDEKSTREDIFNAQSKLTAEQQKYGALEEVTGYYIAKKLKNEQKVTDELKKQSNIKGDGLNTTIEVTPVLKDDKIIIGALSGKLANSFKDVEVKAAITAANIENSFSKSISLNFENSIKELKAELESLDKKTTEIASKPDLYSEAEIANAKSMSDKIKLVNAELTRSGEIAQLGGLKSEGDRLQTGLNAGVNGFTQEKVDNNLSMQLEKTKILYGENSSAALELLAIQRQSSSELLAMEGERLKAGVSANLAGFEQEQVYKNLTLQIEDAKNKYGETSLKALELLAIQKQMKEEQLNTEMEEKDQLFGLGRLTDEAYMEILLENLELIKEKFGEDGIEFAEAEEKVKSLTDSMDLMGRIGKAVSEDIAVGFADAFTDIALNGAGFGDTMKSLLYGLANDFLQAAVQAFILSIIMKSLGIGAGAPVDGVAPSFGDVFGENLATNLNVPTRHNGGSVGLSGDSSNSSKSISRSNPNSSLLPNERLIIAQTDESVVKTNSLQSPTGVGSSDVSQPQLTVNNYVTDDLLTSFLENDRATDSIINIINRNKDRLY